MTFQFHHKIVNSAKNKNDMNKLVKFCILFFHLVGLGFAQKKAKQIGTKPFPVYYYELKNGLKVYLSPNKEKPEIYTAIAVRAGSAYDPADNTGLAHYLEHLLFKGTDEFGTLDFAKEKPYLDQIEQLYEEYNHSLDSLERLSIYKRIDSVAQLAARYAIPNEYDRMVANLGGRGTNAFTSEDQTVYINLIPANQLEKWLIIESERFRDPVFSRLFHTELEAVYEEKNISLDSDDEQLYEKVLATLFPVHPYGQQTTIGTIEHLKNPSIKKIKNYFHKYYVPGNMAIILSGDLDVDRTIDLIERYFGSYPKRSVPERPTWNDPPLTQIQAVELYGPQPERIYILFKLPGANSSYIPHMRLLTYILYNEKTGLIDVELNQKQAVLEASAWGRFLRDYTILGLDGAPKEGQTLEEVKDLLIAQIEKLKQGNFDEAMLKGIIRNYEVELTKRYLENPSRVFAMVDAFTNAVPWESYSQLLEKMKKITKRDLVDFANKYLNYYVVGYKRKGERPVPKIQKPPITPLQVNRDTMSQFFKRLQTISSPELQPYFFNPKQDVITTTIQNQIPLIYVKNEENELFTIIWHWDFGFLTNKLFPIAREYIQIAGTQNLSNTEVQKRFFHLACDWNWKVDNEEMTLSLSGPAGSLPEALELLFQLFNNTEKNEENFQKLKERILKDRKNALNDPNQIQSALLHYVVYGEKSPYKQVVSNQELTELPMDTLINTLRSLFQYPHQVGYYGPLSLQAAQGEFQKFYQKIAIHKIEPKKEFLKPLPVQATTIYVTHFPDMVRASLFWYIPGEPFSVNLLPQVSLFNEYFDGGMSGIIFQEIREAKALAYAAFGTTAYSPSPTDIFRFFAFVGTQADKLPDAVQAMNTLLSTFPSSSNVFNTAMNNLKNSIISTRYLRERKISRYFYLQKLKLDKDIDQIVYENLPSFSMKTIEDYYKQYIQNKPYALTVVGDQNRLDLDFLKSLGTVKMISVNELFGY